MSALGDMLRVLCALHPEGADADRAAELVGLRRTRPAPRRDTIPRTRDGEQDQKGPQPLRTSVREETPLPISAASLGAPAEAYPLIGVEPVPDEDLRYRRAQIELEPLLQPRSARAILSTLVATPAAGPPDIDGLIASMAVLEPIHSVRHLLALTVARGAQVLVDKSPSMAPYRRDQSHLTTQLQRVIGEPRVAVVDFMECPSRGAGVGAIDEWTAYAPPQPRTPVLLLTDLALGRENYAGGTTGEWLAFAREVRAAGCPLLALVPYPAWRYPRVLRAWIAIAHWDRSLTARGARRATGLRDRRR